MEGRTAVQVHDSLTNGSTVTNQKESARAKGLHRNSANVNLDTGGYESLTIHFSVAPHSPHALNQAWAVVRTANRGSSQSPLQGPGESLEVIPLPSFGRTFVGEPANR
jgi:hypothetical protein